MPTSPDSNEPPEDRNAAAKIWMQRGIALLSANSTASLPEALHCFDEALAIRRELPFEDNSWFRWLLTACWMNRGDVLTRLGGPSELREAVRSFDEAIFHLERLPLDDHPQYRGRLILAWMNRSLALRAQALTESRDEALRSLDHATASAEGTSPPNVTLMTTLAMNRAALLLEVSPPRMLEAMTAAETALAVCCPTENDNVLAAEIGLKARHAFCQAVALLLETPPVDTTHADDWIMQATDKVEEALHLVAYWEKQGEAERFRQLRHELFCYGCRIYLAYQPHFLADFLLDVLDPQRGSRLLAHTEDLCQAGAETLQLAAVVLQRRGPLDLGLQRVDRLIDVLESLNRAAARLRQLGKQP